MNAAHCRSEFARRLEETWEQATRKTTPFDRDFSFSGERFRMRFATEGMARTMCRALGHLAVDPTADPVLTIHCWDVASSGIPCPLPDWPENHFTGRGEIRGLDHPEMRVAFLAWIGLLNAYLPESGRAFYCLPDAEQFPVQQLGSPALTLFSWWMARRDFQFLHAAALGTADGAVLIAGHGGAGKSTLSFSSIGSRLDYLADDYCVVRRTPEPEVHSLFSSGKLTEDSLGILPHLRAHTAIPATDKEKAVLFLHESFPNAIRTHARVKAVVLPRLHPSATRLAPASWRDALPVIAGSTLHQIAGSGPGDLFRITRLVRELPVFTLEHGASSEATHQLLLELCAS